MYELRKFKLGTKNTFDQNPNCASLNAKTLRGLINQEGENDYKSLSKKGRMIIRKINDNEILHKRACKADEISRTFQN